MWIHTVTVRKMFSLFCVGALLSACGGGGGGGGDEAAGPGESGGELVISPASIRITYVEQGQDASFDGPPSMDVRARFAASPPQGEVVVAVLQGADVVSRVAFSHAVGNTSHWSVIFNPDLPVGVHEGTLRLLVCGGATCGGDRPTWQTTVPYQVTVKPGIKLSVSVNGRPVTERPVRTRDGDLLSISASVPVDWFRAWTSGAHARDAQETATTWRARAEYSTSTSGHTGSFGIGAGAPQLGARASVTFEVRE